jgi:hypothetical protein
LPQENLATNLLNFLVSGLFQVYYTALDYVAHDEDALLFEFDTRHGQNRSNLKKSSWKKTGDKNSFLGETNNND